MKFSLLQILIFMLPFQTFSMNNDTLNIIQLSTIETKELLLGACIENTASNLERILNSGISPDTTVYPLLAKCLSSGKKEHINLLLNRGATVTKSHILKSINLKDLELFGRLIRQCKNFNCNEKLLPHNNETLLHEASRNGSSEIVEKLISLGADLEAEDDFGYTPLFTAVAHKNIPVIKTLYTKGANIHKKIKSGETALSRLQTTLPELAEEILIEK